MSAFINFFGSYKLLAILSSLIFTLCVSLTVVGRMTDALEDNIRKIASESAKYRTDEIKTRLDSLDKAVASEDLPYLNPRDAKLLLLETLENFRTLYGGRITEELSDSGGRYTAEMEFTVEATNPSQIPQIINYLDTSIAPVITVKKLAFTADSIKKAVFTIQAVQPYYGGTYEY